MQDDSRGVARPDADQQGSAEIAGPVLEAGRIGSIDVLRGVALLGILVMNIRAFATVGAASESPHALGEASGADLWMWLAGNAFTHMKFMAIFSMLFGAGIVLMASRIEEKGARPARVHYRRMLWLFLIGHAHAYLIWSGDILVWYAICGSLVYFARHWRPSFEIALGSFLLLFGAALTFTIGVIIPAEEIQQMNEWLHADSARNEARIAAFRGTWMEQMPYRAEHAFGAQTGGGIFYFLWRGTGLMLIGMGLFKLRVFDASRSMGFYARLLAGGLAIGMPLVVYGLHRDVVSGFGAREVMFLNRPLNYIGSVFVALAWVALVMIVVKARLWSTVMPAVAAVGRMALTNYLMQSVVCTLIFYGHGLGLYGALGFADQMFVVLGLWAAQLVWSPLWLRWFRFGPAEWLWRSLTYWRAQPMRRMDRETRDG